MIDNVPAVRRKAGHVERTGEGDIKSEYWTEIRKQQPPPKLNAYLAKPKSVILM